MPHPDDSLYQSAFDPVAQYEDFLNREIEEVLAQIKRVKKYNEQKLKDLDIRLSVLKFRLNELKKVSK